MTLGGIIAAPQLALPMNVDETGEVRLYVLTLPFLPPSKNVYDNWPGQWKSAAKHKWCRWLAQECAASQVPLGVPRIGLAATLVFASRARRDPQNYAQALWHWVPDGLQRCGVIDGDHEGKIEIGRNWGLTFAYDTRTALPRKSRERTQIALTMRVPTGD